MTVYQCSTCDNAHDTSGAWVPGARCPRLRGMEYAEGCQVQAYILLP
jgi:hypothetical protein